MNTLQIVKARDIAYGDELLVTVLDSPVPTVHKVQAASLFLNEKLELHQVLIQLQDNGNEFVLNADDTVCTVVYIPQ